ncbi:MAG: GUN4 domain protein [Candidatus Saganbacteria bacterium]|uniref:GUN4 domain protein n=1 Tax=Candidatus Saganbacteria bacterium TaxID=2575572 RepID=A0A833P2N5_UNCSA|nr:MAG: GUN4 domain protein [Candidatus Saganbacteria bacterium]
MTFKNSVIILLIFSCSCHAWVLTKEMQKEINENKSAVAKNPKDPTLHFDLAITYAYTNFILEGWDELKKANNLDSNFKNDAQNIYIQKVNQNPSDWKLRFRLAFAYYFSGNKKDAIKELENVLAINPNNAFAYGYISLIYGEMGEIDNAIAAAKKGIKIDYQIAALHLLLAEGYYKKGDSWNGFWERTTAVRLKMQGF